jgi:hypothetical protein
LAASSGFGNSTFITDLQQGLVGALARSLASTSANTYYCRLVGSKFGSCAAAGFTQSTPYPINFFRANPYSNTLIIWTTMATAITTACSSISVTSSLRDRLWTKASHTLSNGAVNPAHLEAAQVPGVIALLRSAPPSREISES